MYDLFVKHFIVYITSIFALVGVLIKISDVWGFFIKIVNVFKGYLSGSHKAKEIDRDQKMRDDIAPLARNYIYNENKNNIKDISVRLIYVKNYPYNLKNDAFKFTLSVDYQKGHVRNDSWLDKTGIYIQKNPWFMSRSIYVDRFGVFFIAPRGFNYKYFHEYSECSLIVKIPFKNIYGFDFEELIEYEPVLYVKYPYTNLRKLWDKHCFIRQKPGGEYINIPLNFVYRIKKYSWIRYRLKQVIHLPTILHRLYLNPRRHNGQ